MSSTSFRIWVLSPQLDAVWEWLGDVILWRGDASLCVCCVLECIGFQKLASITGLLFLPPFHGSWEELSATAITARLPVYRIAPGHDSDRILALWNSKHKINPPFYKLHSISHVFYQSNKKVIHTASSRIARASKLANKLLFNFYFWWHFLSES